MNGEHSAVSRSISTRTRSGAAPDSCSRGWDEDLCSGHAARRKMLPTQPLCDHGPPILPAGRCDASLSPPHRHRHDHPMTEQAACPARNAPNLGLVCSRRAAPGYTGDHPTDSGLLSRPAWRDGEPATHAP